LEIGGWRILVVGAGAIGGYAGAKMALAGHDVTLAGRQPLVDAVAARGLRLIEPDGVHEIRECRAVASVKDAFEAPRRYDLALFTVKTYDTQSAIDELRPYAQNVDRFLSLQNGVSSEDRLSEAFGPERIIAGTILNPVSIREPGVVVLEKRRGGVGLASLRADESASQRISESAGYATGQATIGYPSAESLASDMRRAGFVVRTYDDHRAMKWSKLLLNLIGNATAAILDLNTMEIFRDRRLFAIEIAALREAIRVAQAQGIRFVNLPGYPVWLLAAAVRSLPLSLLQPALIPLVAKGRGSKMPSLHIDLWDGKRRSEIDELNGVVVRIGAQLQVPTPANGLLVTIFKDLQSGSSTERAEWRRQADRLWAMYSKMVREAGLSRLGWP
jgi:2-dehydropantoate 2-reductase